MMRLCETDSQQRDVVEYKQLLFVDLLNPTRHNEKKSSSVGLWKKNDRVNFILVTMQLRDNNRGTESLVIRTKTSLCKNSQSLNTMLQSERFLLSALLSRREATQV